MRRILSILILIIAFGFQASAQEIYRAVQLLQKEPQKAYAIARDYKPDPASPNAAYERYLRIFILLNNPALTDKALEQYVKPSLGDTLSTIIVPVSLVKYKGKQASFTLNPNGSVPLHFLVKGDKKLKKYDTANFVTVRGVFAGIAQDGKAYRLNLSHASQTIVAGPSTVDQNEWQKLLKALEAEDWPSAAELSKTYMDRYLIDPRGLQARLRYMYLYSLAGQVQAGTLSYADLEQKIKSMKGKGLAMPTHPVESGSSCINKICIATDSQQVAYTRAAASDSMVHIVEYVKLDSGINLQHYIGLKAFMGGIIESISVNPDHDKAWILKIYLQPGFIRVED